jgi:hypothetical protein
LRLFLFLFVSGLFDETSGLDSCRSEQAMLGTRSNGRARYVRDPERVFAITGSLLRIALPLHVKRAICERACKLRRLIADAAMTRVMRFAMFVFSARHAAP